MRKTLCRVLSAGSFLAFLLVPLVATSLVTHMREKCRVKEAVNRVLLLKVRVESGDKSYEDSLRRALKEALSEEGFSEEGWARLPDGRHAALAYLALLRARDETLPLDHRVEALCSAANYPSSAEVEGKLIVLLLCTAWVLMMVGKIAEQDFRHGHMMT